MYTYKAMITGPGRVPRPVQRAGRALRAGASPDKELEKECIKLMAKADATGGFMFRLRELDQPLEHFVAQLWQEIICHVTDHRGEGLTFRFQNGTEIRV